MIQPDTEVRSVSPIPPSKVVPETTKQSEPLSDIRDHVDVVQLPALALDVLHQVTDLDLKQRLHLLLTENARDVQEYKSRYQQAQADYTEANERLIKTEVELGDVRSAAALMVTGEEDAYATLKRQYDEEIASLSSISQQQVADVQAASHERLEKEKSSWTLERKTLLARIPSQPNTHMTIPTQKILDTPPRPVRTVGSPNKTISHAEAVTMTRHSVIHQEPTAQGEGEEDSGDVKPFYMERYEMEINRLRRMLEDAAVRNDCGLNVEEGVESSPLVESQQPETTIQIDECTSSISPHQAVNNMSPDATVDHCVNDPTTPVSEKIWVNLQSQQRNPATERRSSAACVMCTNYEHQLQTLQLRCLEKGKSLKAVADHLSVKSAELVEATRNLSELETLLKTRTTGQTERIDQLDSSLQRITGRLDQLLSSYRAHHGSTEKQLTRMEGTCEEARSTVDVLRSHYDALLGRRSKASAELSAQPIQLPSDKTDLELLALGLYEENLSLRSAREHLDERLKSDSQFHRQQLVAEQQERTSLEASLQRDLDDTKARLASLTDTVSERDKEVSARVKAEEELNRVKTQLVQSQTKRTQAESDAVDARAEVSALLQRIQTLQTDLDNAESVQADFVRLSQNLQVQLERLRQQDQDVRWVDPEDVGSCFACSEPFPRKSSGTNIKVNCRHCGKVYCTFCTKNTIPSGPTRRV